MGKKVFANGNEIVAKSSGNKSIAAMPDVCLTPPTPPAGPIPIPYPNFSLSSDLTDGSKTVKIGGKEAGLKNKSNHKKSNGDEAATKSQGMGIVTANIQGKTYYCGWSMDVKFEGKNVPRFMDMTTHNHSSVPQNSASTTMSVAEKAIAAGEEPTCEQLDDSNRQARDELDPVHTPEGFALTTAVGTNANGISGYMKAVSRSNAPKPEFKSGYAESVGAKSRPECSGGGGYDAMRKNDSETKLLDPFMRTAGSGSSIKMKVYHQSKKDGKIVKDSMPCISCRKSICGAQSCGIEVTLCNNENKEVKAEDLCDEGTPKGTGSTSDPFWESKGFGPI